MKKSINIETLNKMGYSFKINEKEMSLKVYQNGELTMILKINEILITFISKENMVAISTKEIYQDLKII